MGIGQALDDPRHQPVWRTVRSGMGASCHAAPHPKSVLSELQDRIRKTDPLPYFVSSGDMIVAMTYAKRGVPYVDESPRVAAFQEGVAYRAEGYLAHAADWIYRFVRVEKCGNWTMIVQPLAGFLSMDALGLPEVASGGLYAPVAGASTTGGSRIPGGRPGLGGPGLGGGPGFGGGPGGDYTLPPVLPPQVTPPAQPEPPLSVIALPPSMVLLASALAGAFGLRLASVTAPRRKC